MVGILVHGDNHLIVRGPLPDPVVAVALVRHWSLIQIGATTRQASIGGISSPERRGREKASDHAPVWVRLNPSEDSER
jgi:hypothetical protein